MCYTLRHASINCLKVYTYIVNNYPYHIKSNIKFRKNKILNYKCINGKQSYSQESAVNSHHHYLYFHLNQYQIYCTFICFFFIVDIFKLGYTLEKLLGSK